MYSMYVSYTVYSHTMPLNVCEALRQLLFHVFVHTVISCLNIYIITASVQTQSNTHLCYVHSIKIDNRPIAVLSPWAETNKWL